MGQFLAGPRRPRGDGLRRFAFEIGIDLRGTPPLPGGYPPTVVAAFVLFAVWAVLLLLVPDAFPVGFRAVASRVCYVGYLLLLVSLWAGLAALSFLAGLFTWVLIHDTLVGLCHGDCRQFQRLGSPQPRRLFRCHHSGPARVAAVGAVGRLPCWPWP